MKIQTWNDDLAQRCRLPQTGFELFGLVEQGVSLTGLYLLVDRAHLDLRSLWGDPKSLLFGWLVYAVALGILYFLFAHGAALQRDKKWAYVVCFIYGLSIVPGFLLCCFIFSSRLGPLASGFTWASASLIKYSFLKLKPKKETP